MARFEYYGKKGLPKVDLEELKGKLIVIEGTDGVGRSTHIGLLKQWFENNGHAVLDTGMTRSALAGEGLKAAKEGHTLGWLTMTWLYVSAFLIGTIFTTAGTAAQIVLTQVVARERLVEAHAKNALATSGAEVAGPALAGALIKLVGAPLALLVDAVGLFASAAILRGIDVAEDRRRRADAHFVRDLRLGVRFVVRHRLLIALALVVGVWQMCHNAALVVQILFATRTLGLSEQAIGLSYMGMGAGTVMASVFGNRISRRIGPGPCLVLGFGLCGAGWLLLAVAPANALGVAAFAMMLMLFSTGAVLVFINFLALRQAVTPEPLLGRMTSTMRWLILLPAGPGALLGGWLGEHFGLRSALAFAGCAALVLALAGWRAPIIRNVRGLPRPEREHDWIGAEADVRAARQLADSV